MQAMVGLSQQLVGTSTPCKRSLAAAAQLRDAAGSNSNSADSNVR